MVVGGVLVLGSSGLIGGSPLKASHTETGYFTCSASAIRTENSSVAALNIEPFAANEQDGAHCTTDSAALTGANGLVVSGVGRADVLFARTNGDANTSEAGVAAVALTGTPVPIAATLLTSQASAGDCATGAELSGSSTILAASVGDRAVAVPSTADAVPEVTIPNVATVFLNYQKTETVAGEQVLTQRALFVDVNQSNPALAAVPDVIIAEAVADIHGDPCAQPEPEDCSAPGDEDGDGLVNRRDPDCGRCPPASPEGEDSTPDEDCGFGNPSDVDDPPKGGRNK